MRLVLLIPLLLPLSDALAADKSADAPKIGTIPAGKILFLGNSITLHAPSPAIGWTGNWGMAASSEEKDFVHLLTSEVAKAIGKRPEIMVRNIAKFERAYDEFQIATGLKSELEFRADIVIVAIGENIKPPTTEDERHQLAVACEKLLKTISRHGQPYIFVRSSFWSSAVSDGIMRKASMDAGATFVDISKVGQDAANVAKSERSFDHEGVANHPGDQGMNAIAGAIFASIARRGRSALPTGQIGYTEFSTNLEGGRHANVRTMRAKIVDANGTETHRFAAELANRTNSWTQFAGWSPDGKTAVVAIGWQSPENAAIEEARKQFHFAANGRSLDSHLIDLATGRSLNVSSVDRVSFYNSGLFYWPGDDSKLGFTALIEGNSHPFKMDIDGRNKVDLTTGPDEFTYGFSSSADGSRIAYHKNYQVYVADADGTNAVRVETGQPFNFAPTWSPNGEWVLFVSGQHYDCHPYVVRADGTGLKKLADRNGYRGVVEFLDVPDFHGGSSDVPVWSADGKHVFYTATIGPSVELFSVDLNGQAKQLTESSAGTLHYHPTPSPDGQWILYGSKRSGVRQLYIRRLDEGDERSLTKLNVGYGAMWPHWQPVSVNLSDAHRTLK